MIHSLAGELGLDVYVLSLSRTGLDDTALAELITDLPERCIALMEDIDAAFHGLENRNLDSPPPPPNGEAQSQPGSSGGAKAPPSASRITLSGLLNAIDGIGAHDGRILYATTNKYLALDPALCRPGRMDLHIEFKLASRYQAQELFRCFYMPGDDDIDDEEDRRQAAATEDDAGEKIPDSGYSSPRDATPERDLISAPAPLSLPSSTIAEIPPPPTIYLGDSHRTRAPQLTHRQVSDLATAFAASIPEREHSMAALQGYLMAYKTRPYEAVKEVGKWVEKERAGRAEKLNVRAAAQTEARTVPPIS